MKGPLWGPVFWGLLVLGSAPAWGSTASDLFDQASAAFSKQDFAGAAVLFARVAKDYPDDPQAVSAAFLKGVSQYQAGQPQAALDSFQKMERIWPLSAFRKRLPYWKGASALAAGLLAVAERELSAQAQFPDEKPWYARSLFQLGLVRLQQGQSDKARELLQQFLNLSAEPEWNSRANLLLGEETRKTGNAADALDRYTRASADAPGTDWDLEARKARVDLLLVQKNGRDAANLVDESAGLFPAQKAFWELRRIEATRMAGDLAASRQAVLARLDHETDPLQRQKLLSNAALLSEQLGQPDPDLWARAAVGPDKDLTAGALRREASLLEASGQWAAAARILAQNPDKEEWLSRAAADYRAAGDGKAALAAWNELVRRYPRSASLPEWLDARAGLLLPLGDTTGALRDLNVILKDFPSYPRTGEVRYQMGLVYLKRDEPLRAEVWFYGLISDLKSGELYERALLARGQSYVNAGKTDLAKGSLERLVRESPNGPWAGDAWYALGKTNLQVRDFARAWDAFSQASRTLKDPDRQAQALWEGLDAVGNLGDAAKTSDLYSDFAKQFPQDSRASEALYRSGNAYAQAKLWDQAVQRWTQVVGGLRGKFRDQTRQGLALSLLQLGRVAEAKDQLQVLEKEASDPEIAAGAWFQWGQAASGLGNAEEATSAFETLIRLHPSSPLVEKALPRAAGALLTGGDADQALARYADFFSRFGTQSSSAAVARAAAQASAVYPDLLEKLVKASRDWTLAPEVKTEFDLAWWKSVLDVDPARALAELQTLSRQAPWSSQRSQALYVAGLWSMAQGKLDDARAYLEAAQALGDDLSVFRARLGLAQVADKDGRPLDGARQKEAAEKAAGPGVPLEFRLAALNEARDAWKTAGKTEDLARVDARIASFTKSP